MSEKIIAYKGMNADMTCRGKQYEVGKTYHEDKAVCCNAGMHACENQLDVLRYYPLSDGIRIFKVECGGDISREDGKDTKLACTELTVEAEIKIADMVKLGVKAVMDRVSKNVKGTKLPATGPRVRLPANTAKPKRLEKTALLLQTAHTVRHAAQWAAIWY